MPATLPEDALGQSVPLKRTVMDAFNKSSFIQKAPEYTFGTSSRPPLNTPGGGPGPGAYPIKSTMGKIAESNFHTPCQFSLKSREKFGDPNLKAMSKTTANEPGPGTYALTGKFLSGVNPRATAFPKGNLPKDKAGMGPGPGSYEPLQSMGKQALSTKPNATPTGFPQAPRPTMVPPGNSDIGPGQYEPPPAACDNQVDSRKVTCSSIKFGTGYKKGGGIVKPHLAEPAPGPGSYTLPGGVATRAKGSPFRDSPSATLSGRNKFGSPW